MKKNKRIRKFNGLIFIIMILFINNMIFGQKKQLNFEHGDLMLNGFIVPTELSYGMSYDNYRDYVELLFDAQQQINYFITNKISLGISGKCDMYNKYNNEDPNDIKKTKAYQYFVGPTLKVFPMGNRIKMLGDLTYYMSNTAYLKGVDKYYNNAVIDYLMASIGFNYSISRHLGFEMKGALMHALSLEKGNYLKLYSVDYNVFYLFD